MTTTGHQLEYAMPSLGADMDVGTVIEWNVGVGDEVHRGDVVARVETEKSDIDIEIWLDGTVTDVLVPPGRRVPVGTPLLHVAAAGADEAVPASSPVAAAKPVAASDEPAAGGVGSETISPRGAPVRPHSGEWATPLARRLAAERGVDLADLSGSGPGGAVRARDVPDAATRPAADSTPLAPAVSEPGTAGDSRELRMRRAIAMRMSKSHREIPLYHLERQVDLAALHDHLGALNAEREISERVLPAAAFIDAVARSAAKHTEMNGHWIDDRFVAQEHVDVGVAISIRGGGLVTPIIDRADQLDMTGIMDRLRVLTMEARAGVMRGPSGGGLASITVTNLGERGADLVHGLISPPEVALVGFGRVIERPWVVDGEIVARPIVNITLAADHRATDGATGSRFLTTIARALENPEDR